MYTLNGWWLISSGGSYPPVFMVVYRSNNQLLVVVSYGATHLYKCPLITVYTIHTILVYYHNNQCDNNRENYSTKRQ